MDVVVLGNRRGTSSRAKELSLCEPLRYKRSGDVSPAS